jgi:hypothetical protein
VTHGVDRESSTDFWISACQHRAVAAEARHAQNQFRVFNFIQTPIVYGRTLLAIEPLSQGDRAFNSTY